MTFISYAQNNEDVLLWRALGHIKRGFYVDVGANDPVEHSVTKAFYDAGWSGINIEPLPIFHKSLLEARPRDTSLALAAGATEGELTLYDIPAVNGWASPERAVAEAHRADGFEVAELTVPVRTLAAICAEHVKGEIHFLKIDVEGFEGEVLRGMDFVQWRPWVLVIEATLPNSRVSAHGAWEHLVIAQRYRFAWFDGLNRYYVAEEHTELMAAFRTQPNVFDEYISHHLDKAWTATSQLTHAVRDTEAHAATVTEALRESQAQSVSVTQALHEAQAQTKSVTQALHESQAQAKSVTQALHESQAQTDSVTQALRESQAYGARVTQALHESKACAARLSLALREAETQAAESAARMHDALQRTWQVRDQLEAGHERADSLGDRIAEQARENHAAQAEIETLRAALVQAQLDGHHVSEWASGLEQRLVATLASSSWRVTGPLRAAGAALRDLRRPGRARRVLARLSANERLRRWLIPVLLRYPSLRKLVEAKLIAIKHAPDDAASDETRDLPVSARSVLADLQRARGEHTGS
jgi:FkbM family methyltransferase